MKETYKKIDDYTLETTKTPAVVPVVSTFRLEDLLERKTNLEARKERVNAEIDEALDDVNECIAKCGELKIVARK